MIKLFKYVTLLVSLGVYVAWSIQTNSYVYFSVNGFEVELPLGIFGLFLTLFGFAFYYLLSAWHFARNFGTYVKNYFNKRKVENSRYALLNSVIRLFEKDYEAAANEARKAEKGIKNTQVPLVLEAKALEYTNVEEAQKAYDKLIEDVTTQHVAYASKIRLLLRVQNYKAALAVAEEANEALPKEPDLAQYLCEIYIRLGMFEEALDVAERYYKASPYFAASPQNPLHLIYFGLGQLAENENRFEETSDYYYKSLGINEAFIPAAIALGKMLVHSHSYYKARKVLMNAWKQNPHAKISELLVAAHEDFTPSQKYNYALTLLETQPSSVDIQLLAARLAFKAELHEKARQHCDDAVELNGGHSKGTLELMVNIAKEDVTEELNYAYWLKTALEMVPEKKWHCTECAHQNDVWQFSCTRCNALNSYKWKE